jgi:type I restriction enzyme S subunit
MREALLASLIDFSRDGEWGKADPGPGLTKARVVRGADFDAFRHGELSGLPTRFIQDHKVGMKRLQAGDILIETAGGTQDRPTGRTVLVRDELIAAVSEPLLCASFARFIRVDRAKINPEFLSLWLDNAWKSRALQRWNVQHTGVARFHWTKCSEALQVPLPDPEIQALIAGPLIALDRLIAINRRRVELLEEMARAIYREWFVKFRYPGHDDVPLVDSALGLIPEGWKASTCGAEITSIGGGTPSKKEPAYWDGGTVAWYTPSDLTRTGWRYAADPELRITEQGVAKSSARLFPAGSVMMTSRATLGVLAVATIEATTNQGFIVVLPDQRWTSGFVYEWLDANADALAALGTGSTFKEITKGRFKGFPFLVPAQRVLDAYRETTEPIEGQVRLLEQQMRGLTQLRDLLLPQLVTGQIDVSTLDLDALVSTSSTAGVEVA